MAKSVGKAAKKKVNMSVDEELEEEISGISDEQIEINKGAAGNLEDLTGVGPTIAEKLREGGYNTFESLSVASPKEIAATTGIGEATAQKIIMSARSRLNIGFMTAEKLFDERKKI
ncbi:MAG: helix-hairpin-helix domain-containing protein, partial [Candidatus Helarchaeota archaeon]